ncbi:hypothetical protein [Arthrobacter monumenti]
MNEDDVKNVWIAAADLESAEFERDHATLNLDSRVAEALEHGQSVEDIAKASGLEPSEIIAVADMSAEQTSEEGIGH